MFLRIKILKINKLVVNVMQLTEFCVIPRSMDITPMRYIVLFRWCIDVDAGGVANVDKARRVACRLFLNLQIP